MTEAEILALLAEALPTIVAFVEKEVGAGKAGAEIKVAADTLMSWFETRDGDLGSLVAAADKTADAAEDIKFGPKPLWPGQGKP